MEVLELAGIGEIKVRRSANIKYLRIRMAPGRGVWVSVPFGVSRKQVEKFLEENREWILKNRKDMKVYEEDTGVGLGIGAEIKTKLHVLRIVETEEPKPSYRLEQEKITLFIPKKVDFSKVEKIVAGNLYDGMPSIFAAADQKLCRKIRISLRTGYVQEQYFQLG